jgi:hypothetical protein
VYDIVELVDNAACGLVTLKPKIEALAKAKQALEVNASTGHRDERGGSEQRGREGSRREASKGSQ